MGIDRQVLARALALGCLTARVADGKPVVFEGAAKTLITVALDPTLAVEAADTDPAARPTPLHPKGGPP